MAERHLQRSWRIEEATAENCSNLHVARVRRLSFASSLLARERTFEPILGCSPKTTRLFQLLQSIPWRSFSPSKPLVASGKFSADRDSRYEGEVLQGTINPISGIEVLPGHAYCMGTLLNAALFRGERLMCIPAKSSSNPHSCPIDDFFALISLRPDAHIDVQTPHVTVQEREKRYHKCSWYSRQSGPPLSQSTPRHTSCNNEDCNSERRRRGDLHIDPKVANADADPECNEHEREKERRQADH